MAPVALVVDSKWLAANVDNPDVVILDTRGNTLYLFGHIKNAPPLGLETVVSVAQNGVNLVIDSAGAEKIFGSYGIDGSKKVIVYGGPHDQTQTRVPWSLLYHGHPETARCLTSGFRGGRRWVCQSAATLRRHGRRNFIHAQMRKFAQTQKLSRRGWAIRRLWWSTKGQHRSTCRQGFQN